MDFSGKPVSRSGPSPGSWSGLVEVHVGVVRAAEGTELDQVLGMEAATIILRARQYLKGRLVARCCSALRTTKQGTEVEESHTDLRQLIPGEM